MFLLPHTRFESVDTYLISMVTSGLYDGDTYCQFLSPVLCRIIGWVAKVFPASDAYVLLTQSQVILAVLCVGFMIRAQVPDDRVCLVCESILAAVVVGLNIPCVNFTIQAAFFTMAGWFVFLSAAKEENRGRRHLYLGAGCWFICCGYMWRSSCALLALPYVGADIFFHLMENHRKLGRTMGSWAKVLWVPALCLVLLGLNAAAVNGSDNYAPSVDYNFARSALADYPHKPWADVREILEPQGITENDYNSVQSLQLLDTQRITAEYMRTIDKAGRVYARNTGMGQFLSHLKMGFWDSYNYAHLIFTVVFLSVLLAGLWSRCRGTLWRLVCIAVGTLAICFYFYTTGRLPDRVLYAIALSALISLFPILIRVLRGEGEMIRWTKRVLVLTAALTIVLTGWHFAKQNRFVACYPVFHAKVHAEQERFSQTYQGDSLYIWNVYTLDAEAMTCFMEQGKLPSREFLDHNIPAGEWTYGQVYFNNYLRRLNAENPMTALLEREHTYYVDEEPQGVLTYLREHVSDKVQMRQTGEVVGIPAWEFYIP